MMRQKLVSGLLFFSSLLAGGSGVAQVPPPPPTQKSAVVDTLHGVVLVDPYRWLEDQQSAETRAWIDVQNGYTDKVLDALPGRDGIERRLTELLRIDVIGMPFVRGGRYFFSKRRADQDLSVLYVRRTAGGPDEVVMDPHALSPDHSVSVGYWDVSTDGRLVAYGVRAGGEDEVRVRFLDLDTGTQLGDSLPRARYSGVAIARDKSGYFYSRRTPAGPRVYYHRMGANPARDSLVFGEGYGPEKIIGVSLDDAGRYLQITVSHGSAAKQTELYVSDVQRRAPLRPIVNDVEARFSGAIAGDRLFLRTNWNAPNNKILVVDLANPGRDRWRELVPESPAVIQGFSVAGGRLFVNVLENVQSRLKVFDAMGRLERTVELPSIGAVSGVSGAWDRDEAFFAFSSFAQPTTIYRYQVASGRREVWARLAVPVASDSIEIKQVWYTSRDGTRVPMFVAYKKGLPLDGRNPTLLTGYGGFTSSSLPGFSQRAAFWVERGGVYALANLRGGGEFGEAWHQAGMLERKQNVFDDFIAAAEWLVANGYTSPAKLAISGGSNGGLLVGAAMTQHPDLFAAVVCTYPLLDMVRYHKFLVAPYWVPEYGSADDGGQFRYLHAYSPYHRVRPGERYPGVLFITGDADTRVDPLHARKMTALVQAATASGKPVLLRYHTKAGHSGGRPVSQVIGDLAEEMQFLFWQLGVGEARAIGSGN